jgi:ketosteroid isomerase-like protein
MSEKASLFAELKRRNVFRVALTYAVIAWLLIEIASALLQVVDAPRWIISAFLVLLAVGFAVALFISWAFEMTPEGLKRTEDLSPGEVIPYWSRRKFARFIIGIAVVAFGLSAYQLLVPKRAGTFSANTAGSIPADSQPQNASDTNPVTRILRDLDAEWSRAAAAKDVEQTVAYYSDDAVVLPPNAGSATTKGAIRSLWKDLLASPGLMITWKPARVQLAKSGEMAWVSGAYELSMNDAGGKPINDRGKYLEVWEKQSDGKWKCVADTWNSDLVASTPGPADKK